jgi:exonuclease SbcC
MNVEGIRNRIGAKFKNVQEVAGGVLRSERRQGENALAVYLFDLNNRVAESAVHLDSYLDDVLGHSYFDEAAPADLRWNHYLYMVADSQSATGDVFEAAKRKIESNKSYARKFVVSEEDLERALARIDSIAEVHGVGPATDIVQTWSVKLVAAGLENVLDPDCPIAEVVRAAASRPVKATIRSRRESGTGMSELLASAPLASIDLSAFREYPSRKQFSSLGRANLIVGVNGTGKTSLLEGIEYLYCGANRRSNSDGSKRVQGRLSSGAGVETRSSQELSDFKTRQRSWYGSDDVTRRNLLPYQFGRFNFLNTDAAAELTLADREKGPPGFSGNSESLAALLSGDEATLLWRRIQAVNRAVGEEKRRLEADRHAKEADRREAEAERKTLESAPQKSDALFAVLAQDLEIIGWIEKYRDKNEFAGELVTRLAELASRLGVLHQVTWAPQQVSPAWLAAQVDSLRQSGAVLRTHVQKVTSAQQAVVRLTSEKAELDRRLTALESISPRASAQLVARVQELSSIERDLTEATRAMSAALSRQGLEIDPALINTALSSALVSSRAQLRDAQGQAAQHRRTLMSLRTSQSSLQSLASELRQLVHTAFAHGHSENHCPVCGSHFEQGKLKARIDALALGAGQPDLAEAERAASSAERRAEALSDNVSWLEGVQKFCAAVSIDPEFITVSAARDAVDGHVRAYQELLARRDMASQAVDEFRRNGLTVERLRGLCEDLTSQTATTAEQMDVAAATTRVRSAAATVTEERDKVSAQLAASFALCEEALSSVGIETSGTLQQPYEELRARLDTVEAALEACKWARSVVSLTTTTDLQHLFTVARSAVMSATELAATLDTEARSSDRMVKVQSRLRRLDTSLSSLHDSISRLQTVVSALTEIVERYSLESATHAAVAATHTVADEIFARIHSPAEYKIATQGDLPLVRRDDGRAKELSAVSTGQRAAYALSMFLAMNAQVRNAPPALMMDDPISHIDDLNALSFLDYLRNLVLRSQRQVFFATADDKVAGLFAHKFSFLGDGFRTIELTR